MNKLELPLRPDTKGNVSEKEEGQFTFQRNFELALSDMEIIVLSIFKWTLPLSVDLRQLELSLYYYGYVVFFEDENLGLLALPCTLCDIDIYQNPHSVMVELPNGYTLTLSESKGDKFVIVYNNIVRKPSCYAVENFALLEANIMCSIWNNLKQQQFPYIVQCTEEQRLSFLNIVNNMKSNAPYIFMDTENNLFDSIRVFNTNVPHIIPDLYTDKHNNRNDFLTYFGIYNSNSDKRERLVSSETNSNIGAIEMSRNAMLDSREQGIRELKEIFGDKYQFEVEFNSDIQLYAQQFVNGYHPVTYQNFNKLGEIGEE